MSTTVRVENEVKAELDRLQGLVQAETGERISQSELLARLLRHAKRHTEVVLHPAEPTWSPPSREQLRKWLDSLPDWGVETDASKIDEVLYEDP